MQNIRSIRLICCLFLPPIYIALLTAFATMPVYSQEADSANAVPQNQSRKVFAAKFLGGMATGFAAHESGHILFDVVFDASPGIDRVSFGSIPFFAITHKSGLPKRQEYIISSAGFQVQNLTSEWLLTSRPDLRQHDAPFMKGWFAWNVVASTAYGIASFTHAGPYERDTRGMASSVDIPEPWIGGMVLAPAALDVWRYFKPETRWIRWTSRFVKAGAFILIFAAN